MWLIVGLGNPGRTYKNTRHNIGYMVVDRWAGSHGLSIKRFGVKFSFGRGKVDGQEVLVLKPRTYMNLSGQAVQRAIKKFNLDASRLVVVHDDLDIAFGEIKISKKGGGRRT